LFLFFFVAVSLPGQWLSRTWTGLDGLVQDSVSAITRDDQGYLLLFTKKGVVRFDGLRFEKVDALPVEIDAGARIFSLEQSQLGQERWSALKKFVNPDSVIAVNDEDEDILWFGTEGGGFGNLYRSPFTFYTTEEGLSHPHVTGIFQDKGGIIWLGAWGGGVNRFDAGSRTIDVPVPKSQLYSGFITTLYGDGKGNLWIGTIAGLNRLKNGVLSTYNGPAVVMGSYITALYVDNGGRVWAGVRGHGLFCFNEKENAFRHRDPQNRLTNLEIKVITGDDRGNLWIGTDRGLFMYRQERFRFFSYSHGLADDYIHDIYPEPGGALWIATREGGLHRYKHGEFYVFTFRGGTFLKGINRVMEDNRRRLWLTTAEGLVCVHKKDLNRRANGETDAFDYFHFRQDGLLSLVFSGGFQPAGWKTADGHLWLPTANGVTVAPDVKEEFFSGKNPVAHILKLTADGDTVAPDRYNHIPPGTETVVIWFNAPYYKAPGMVRYKYRLEGNYYNTSGYLPARLTVQPGEGPPKVVFEDLPSGYYYFTVTAAASVKEWDYDSSASVEFYIKESIDETFEFYLLLLGIGLAVAVGVLALARKHRKEKIVLPIWSHDHKYKTFKLSNRESRNVLRRLLQLMEKEKSYLDADITLPGLAEMLGIGKEVLSQVINRELFLNFNAFINGYRVEEAKKKLRDPKENQFVILKIAHDVGFNSKSSFNAVFKKVTGMNPKDYRDKYQQEGDK
jgi:ligand-binding sensor domain-containing protein/AraC-like DNA-binding protein